MPDPRLSATAGRAAGWVLDRARGSHYVFRHPERQGHMVVTHPKKDLGGGLVAAIRKQTGLQEMTMRYPVAIEPGHADQAFGVVVPDLPGCFSAGDTVDEAMSGVEEAAAAWIDATLDAGGALPPPSDLGALRDRPGSAGWSFGVVTPANSPPAPARMAAKSPRP